MSEPLPDPFDDTIVFSGIIDERDDIQDRLAHGKQLTARQAQQVRRLIMQWSPPNDIDDEKTTAQAISLFSHRLKRFTQMLRTACYDHNANLERTAEDLEFLLEMAETVIADRSVDVESEVAMAALRGVRQKSVLLDARGGCVGPGQFAELIGVQRETPRKRWETGKLIGVRSGNRLHLPIWQLQEFPDETGVLELLPGVADVIQIVRRNHGNDWDVFAFFLSDNIHLMEESNDAFSIPLDALKANESELVARVAEATFSVQ